MNTQKDYEKGYEDGRKWQQFAESHPDQEKLNPFFPPNPSKLIDTSNAYRIGARCGIGDEKYKRKKTNCPYIN